MNSIIHTKSFENTLQAEILANYGIQESDLQNIDTTIEEIFNLKDENGIEVNKNSIVGKYNGQQLFDNDFEANIDVVLIGSQIEIPESFHIKASAIHEGKIANKWNVRQYQSLTKFYSDKIRDILQDELNKPVFTSEQFIKGSTDYEFRNVSIRAFIISKALKEKVVNISAYIITANWNTTADGGNFDLSLGSPTASIRNGGSGSALPNEPHWQKDNTNVFVHNEEINFTFQDAVNFLSEFYNDKGINNKYRNFYFEKILQSNDIIFIRGERLLQEDSERNNIDRLEFCDVQDLKNRVWDMIGLIDKVSVNHNNVIGAITVDIIGRDLIKVLIDDDKIIFPELIAQDGTSLIDGYRTNFIANIQDAKKSPSVFRLLGAIQEIFLQTNQSVSRLISFVFDLLSFIQVSQNPNLFDSFKDGQVYVSHDETQGDKIRYGIWNLMEVFTDKSVENRYLRDSSLASEGGNLLSFIKKICSPPFVEFLADTYGDRYYWIVRQSPFDFNSYKANLNLDFQVIKDTNVVGFNVDMSGDEFYSYYKIVPENGVFGNSEYAKYLFPVIYLKEIAEIYGNKVLEMPIGYFDGKDINLGTEQALQDLRYLIESTVYKPFSRKGQITILGDRRWKKGMNCYFEPTGEMFYIKGVSNQYSIQDKSISRTTVLEVERGIVLRHYDKYFNIVDFSGDQNITVQDRRKDWKINTDVFQFFIEKKQFDHENDYELPLPNTGFNIEANLVDQSNVIV